MKIKLIDERHATKDDLKMMELRLTILSFACCSISANGGGEERRCALAICASSFSDLKWLACALQNPHHPNTCPVSFVQGESVLMPFAINCV